MPRLITNIVWLLAVVLLPVLAGCSRSESAASVAAPVSPSDGVRAVEIRGGDDMKFDVKLITAVPGEKLRIVLINVGRQPKAAMGHNWVLLKKRADVQAFMAAAIHAGETDYLPVSLQSEVLAHSELIGPNERSVVLIEAPAEAGDYTYLCSFPAHYQLGMRGVLRVAASSVGP